MKKKITNFILMVNFKLELLPWLQQEQLKNLIRFQEWLFEQQLMEQLFDFLDSLLKLLGFIQV
jgi:hypothetical protein